MMGVGEILFLLRHPRVIPVKVNYRCPTLLRWMSDEQCQRFWFRWCLGKRLDLAHPVTFSEKLQWLKLHDRRPAYTALVDKQEVKGIVAARIGAEYVIPTLGVWDRFEDIDFDALPERFVLKCTHDSGGLVICRDRKDFDREWARRRITRSLRRNFYWVGREWPYRDVRPRIIAEPYMEDAAARDLRDYKFYCFGGEAVCCQVIGGRSERETMDFFDRDWRRLPFTKQGTDGKPYPHDETLMRPTSLARMWELAGELSQELPFARVDLYEIAGRVYFGEITLYPNSGLFNRFAPPEWDEKLGALLTLPES